MHWQLRERFSPRRRNGRRLTAMPNLVSDVEFQCVFVQFYPSMKHARFDRADRRFGNSRYLLHGIAHLVGKRQYCALL
jgi:hypothetical protein